MDGGRDLVTSLGYLSGWFNAAVEARSPGTKRETPRQAPRHFVARPVPQRQRD